MRAIGWLVLSCVLLIQNPGAEGQDARRPDAQGKKPEPKGIQIQVEGLQLQFAPQPGGGLDNTIDRLVKDLEDLRRDLKKIKAGPKPAVEPKLESKKSGAPGWMIAPGGSHVDQKLDMILKQMEEMRRDISELKNRIPAAKEKDKKGPGPGFQFKGFFGPKGPMPKDRKPGFAPGAGPQKEVKPDAALQRAVHELKERVQAEADRERQRAQENAMLKQHIERLLQEVEQLRGAIRKANPKKGS